MARTSQRLSAGGSAHKRVASAVSTNGSAVKKSRVKDESEDAGDEDIESSEVSQDEASDFDENDEEAEESEEESEDDEYDSDEPPRSRKKTASRKSHTNTSVKANVWQEGVSAGLGPGKQVIIQKPKARKAGSTPYSDDTLHPNTFLFLTDLKNNNNRPWLKMNDPDFRQSEQDWYSFVEKMTERLTAIDETIPELPVKDVIFRIYRDVRFSPDPTPYKAHFSVAFSRTGRKGPYAAYYVQIAPDDILIAGGLWYPAAAPLALLRQAVDSNSRALKDVLSQDGIRKEFLKGAPKNDAKIVKAFVAANAESALKTKPKGYDADHADIDLLRLRNYTVMRKLPQEEVMGEGGLDRIADLFTCLQPFITYLNSVVMPDEAASEQDNADSDESEDRDE